jgi:hypothetical protein
LFELSGLVSLSQFHHQSRHARDLALCYNASPRDTIKIKKAGLRARNEVEVRQKVKTFQRERPTRQRREERGDAALKSAAAHIDLTAPLCNAACHMRELHYAHSIGLNEVGPSRKVKNRIIA